jgi:hypothetical protein
MLEGQVLVDARAPSQIDLPYLQILAMKFQV